MKIILEYTGPITLGDIWVSLRNLADRLEYGTATLSHGELKTEGDERQIVIGQYKQEF